MISFQDLSPNEYGPDTFGYTTKTWIHVLSLKYILLIVRNSIYLFSSQWSLLYHDNTESSADVAAMSEEEKQWLQNAFDSAILDEMKRIKVLLHVLTLPEDARKLFIMSYHSKGAIAALEKKRTLRTLLEMRQEDEARKAQGLPTIANEEVTVNDDVHTTSDETIPEPTEDELRALRNKVRDEKLDALDELHDRVLKYGCPVQATHHHD